MTIIIKNNLLTPTTLLLMTTLTTNGMEIVPSRKFEKTDNIIRNFSKTEKNIELPIQSINQRPIIKAKLYINHAYANVVYAGSAYHKFLNKIGIKSSIQNQQEMPLIGVIVIPDKEEFDWNNHTPQVIEEYERKEARTKKDLTKIHKKTFPKDLPADLLYQYKTGDTIYLTVHGYPVIATCMDNPRTLTNLPFKEHFTYQMDVFTKKANILCDMKGKYSNTISELQDMGLINNSQKHGSNRFISIEKLLLEDKHTSNTFNYLKNREIGYKTSKIFSDQKNFEPITQNDSSTEDKTVYKLLADNCTIQ